MGSELGLYFLGAGLFVFGLVLAFGLLTRFVVWFRTWRVLSISYD